MGEKISALLQKFNFSKYGWSGNYSSWQDAVERSTGYDQQLILEKVRNAVLKVKNGEAVYERDSVIFDRIEYSWPLLTALLLAAAKNGGTLSVLDFGGSLGGSYFQNRAYLDELKKVDWAIVEQQHYVDAGNKEIADDRLRFFYSVSDYISRNGLPDIIMLSCVLPYLQDPWSLLEEIVGYGIPFLLIDNTPFNYEEKDRLTIQKIPPEIFKATIPAWFLSYERVKVIVTKKYEIVSEHKNDAVIQLDSHPVAYRGFLARLK